MLTRAGFPLELLTVMRERPNVCKYLDIALQHCSDHMLQQMRRGISKKQTIELIRKIRQEVPGIFIRTTLMTGHPGETAEDFEELCEFVREMRFERLGVFPYSHEDDTWCDRHYQDDVPEEIKRERGRANHADTSRYSRRDRAFTNRTGCEGTYRPAGRGVLCRAYRTRFS